MGDCGSAPKALVKAFCLCYKHFAYGSWVFFGLKTPAVASRVTKMAITRFRGSKTRGTFDHRMRNFLLFDFVSRNIC